MSKFSVVELMQPLSHAVFSHTADSTCGETATGDLKVCPIRPVLKWKNLLHLSYKNLSRKNDNQLIPLL
jgi:hypothetical protein